MKDLCLREMCPGYQYHVTASTADTAAHTDINIIGRVVLEAAGAKLGRVDQAG